MLTIEQELESFTQFARGHIFGTTFRLSLDELFDQWRAENPPDELRIENTAAINAAISDFRNGDRGTPAGKHSAQLRHEFGMDRS